MSCLGQSNNGPFREVLSEEDKQKSRGSTFPAEGAAHAKVLSWESTSVLFYSILFHSVTCADKG